MRYCFVLFALVLTSGYNAAQTCYELVWADEFEGTTLDNSKWSYEWGGGGWGNNESQYYTNTGNNIEISNGTLKIIAKEEAWTSGGGQLYNYTSARLYSRYKSFWKYGKFEALIKMPEGQGIWPAFWMSPNEQVYGGWPHSGEIDITEVLGHQINKTHASIHSTTHPGSEATNAITTSENLNDGFHLYSMMWEEESIRIFFDDVEVLSVNPNVIFDAPYWPFDQNFYFRMNVAVGGNWPGYPDASTVFPQQMEVAYVRVYQRSAACLTACEQINNGMFIDGLNDWNLYTINGAAANQVVQEGEMYIDPTGLGNAGWNLALQQSGLNLEQGKTYELQFTGRAESFGRTLIVVVSKQNGDQYLVQYVGLNPYLKTERIVFTMNDPTDTNARLNFNIGQVLDDVYLDNITLQELDCDNPCESNYYLNDYHALSENFNASNLIESSGVIDKEIEVNYRAGNRIDLLEGFETQSGAVFKAEIAPCP